MMNYECDVTFWASKEGGGEEERNSSNQTLQDLFFDQRNEWKNSEKREKEKKNQIAMLDTAWEGGEGKGCGLSEKRENNGKEKRKININKQ